MAPNEANQVNWLLIAEFVVIVIVCAAFLFYWNRLFGSVCAFFIRFYSWRKNNAYISIGSLQISPLAGRISFRDVEYHSSNISFRALHGHITFRYWLLRVRREDDTASSNPKRNKLPCRISVFAQGVEGFVYNRTPAYDEILQRMKKHEKEQEESTQAAKASGESDSSNSNDQGPRLRKAYTAADEMDGKVGYEASSTESNEYPPKALPVPNTVPPLETPPPYAGVDWFREAMPMEIKVMTGSIVLGNDATPMVLIGDFKQAAGTVEVSDSRSIFDRCKTSYNLNFIEPKVLMRTNVDWSGPILAHGKKAYDEILRKEPDVTKSPPSTLSARLGFYALARKFPFLRDPKFSSPPVAGLPKDKVWKGLARYRENAEDDTKGPPKEEREYAKVTTLLWSPALDLSYYSDTPGPVPHPSEVERIDETDQFGNLDLPPEYGIDLALHGGGVNYGPWADRQRDALQRAFAPSIFFDTEPRRKLKQGETRIHTALVLNVSILEDVTLRIPTREPSKDWQIKHPDTPRTYAWLDVRVGANSSIIYTQAQCANKFGYDAMVVLHLDSLDIASSVNLQSFIKAKACRLSITMPTPLQWNAQRNWGLDVTLETPDITLLRDHVTLISDLARDWSSGAVGDFHHFVPVHYNFRVVLLNYAIHLLINDFNIIDRPQSRDDNAILDFYGPRLISHAAVASTRYRPEFSVVPFTVSLGEARLDICIPKWDTHRSFSEKEVLEIGKIGKVTATGTYRYYSSAKPDHQEQLILHLEGKQGVFKALGWVLRRVFCVKDNYFGSFTQFTTTPEFLERFEHDPNSVGDPVEEKYQPGRSDPFGVQVTMNIEESLILMSEEIYDSKRGIAMPLPQFQMSLKSIEPFMELSLDATPTYIVPIADLDRAYEAGIATLPPQANALFIEGISLKANRLFGPQPRATTYLCLWEAIVPKLSGVMRPDFISTLQASIEAVVYNFSDVDNAPAKTYIPVSPPDVTFFKLTIDSISVTILADDNAIVLNLPSGVNLDTSTLASRTCGSVLGVALPELNVNILKQTKRKRWHSCASIRTGLSTDVYKAKRDWEQKASEQQRFLQEQDGPTQRISYMYKDGGVEHTEHHRGGVYMPIPRAIGDDEDELNSVSSTGSEQMAFSDSSIEQAQDYLPHRSSPLRYRSRTRSFATAKETIGNDLSSEESGSSSSSHSSRSSSTSTSDQDDICSSLAAKLRTLRSYRQVHSKSGSNNPTMSVDTSVVKHSFEKSSCGQVIRLALSATTVEIKPEAALCVAKVLQAMQRVFISAERILDSLLIKHTDSVLADNRSAIPLTLDASIPSLQILLPGEADLTKRPPCDLTLSSLGGRMHKVVSEHGNSITLQGNLGKMQLAVFNSTASLPISLEGISGTASSPDVSPVLVGVGEKWRIGSALTSRTKYGSCDLGSFHIDMVTPAFPALMSIVDSWQNMVSTLPKDINPGNRAADVLGSIIQSTYSYNPSVAFPAFTAEGAYGLHLEDQRNIRRDLGWWLLARLRHWYRLSPSITPRVPIEIPETDAEWAVRNLMRMDDVYGADESLFRQQTFLRLALRLPEMADEEGEAGTCSMSISANMRDTALAHHGRLLGTTSTAKSVVQLTKASFGVQEVRGSKDGSPVRQIRVLVPIEKINLEVQNSIIPFIQSILGGVGKPNETKSEERAQPSTKPTSLGIIAHVQLRSAELSICANDLRLRALLQQQHLSTEYKSRPHDLAHRSSHLSSTAGAEVIDVSLLVTDANGQGEQEERTVLSFNTSGLQVVADKHRSARYSGPNKCHLSLGVKRVVFESRPQIKAFLSFAHDWKDRHYSKYSAMLEEIIKAPGKKPTGLPTPLQSQKLELHADVLLESAQIQVRAAKAVWLRWEMGKIFVIQQKVDEGIRFGAIVAPQTIGAYPSSKPTKAKNASSVKLPSIHLNGAFSSTNHQPKLMADVKLGLFTAVIKPALLDRLLSLYQKMGADALEVYRDYKDVLPEVLKTTPGSPANLEPEPAVKTLLDLQISISGIRVGLRADNVPATLLFEALSLKGNASNQSTGDAVVWRAKVDHFGLSLGRIGHEPLTTDVEPIKKHRSGYMTLDIDVQEIPGNAKAASHLSVSLNHVHTVSQVAALSELSDLIKSWTSDLQLLRDSRAAEVAEVKQRTSKILRKIELVERGSQPAESWFASRLFTVNVTGLGIAIPLSAECAIDLMAQKEPIPALLFSIRVISFQNRRNETARFRVQQMVLQFLQKFDQTIPEHFTGDFHFTRNRMSLPSLDAQAQMSSRDNTWSLSAHCSATDFKLSLSPDFADGVFELMDLYAKGRDHITYLEQHYRTEMSRKEASETVAVKCEQTSNPPTSRPPQRIIVRMSFTFNSGVVELHRVTSDSEMRMMASDLRGRTNRVGSHDTFTLPSISAWIDYAGADHEMQEDDRAAKVVLNFAVHESHNVLRPTILPFFSEIASRAERRIKDRSHSNSPVVASPPSLSTLPSTSESTLQVLTKASSTNIKLSFTLRIDRSELRFSCAPDSNAFVDLKWASGGFVASTTIGREGNSSVAGTISGVTASLSHEFADQGRSCIEAGSRDMIFSVSYDPSWRDDSKGLSVVIDTSLSAQFRLDAFSAWLIFISVWVDNTPVIDMPTKTAPQPSPPAEIPVLPQKKLGIAVLTRVRSLEFDADIGVSKATLHIAPIILHTLANGEVTNVQLRIGVTELQAKGDISGDIRSESLHFSTTRKSSRASGNTDPTVLAMSIAGGNLSGNLFLGEMNIVRFHLDPSDVSLVDDWKAFTRDPEEAVVLAFTVHAGQLSGVVRLLAIPSLLGNIYSILDLTESQTKIAMQRSEAFKDRQIQKSNEPSPVAVAILQSVRKAGEGSNASQVKTTQTMRFDLAGLDVGVYNEDYELGQNAEFYRFVAGKIEADLRRGLSKDDLPKRELNLLVQFVRWDTSDGQRTAQDERRTMSAKDMIDKSTKYGRREVASLPSMTLSMASVEYRDLPMLEYDFSLVWGETNGDIAILPNFFTQAFRAFNKLLAGLDEQEANRARRIEGNRRGSSPKRGSKSLEKDKGATHTDPLQYRRREASHQGPMPIPKLKLLGEGTVDAARLVPEIRKAVNNLPSMSHRFVVLPLEEGMDLLLKLYEKQLPDQSD